MVKIKIIYTEINKIPSNIQTANNKIGSCTIVHESDAENFVNKKLKNISILLFLSNIISRTRRS